MRAWPLLLALSPLQTQEPRLPPLPGDLAGPLPPELTQRMRSVDPTVDGWTSEVAAAEILRALAGLGALLDRAGELDPGDLALAADDFAGTPLRPAQLEITSAGAFRVRRPAQALPVDASVRGRDGLAAAVRELAAPFAGAVDTSFKATRIEQTAEGWTAEVIFHADGRPGGSAVQQNAHWTTRWSSDSPGGGPRALVSIQVDAFEEVLGPGDGRGLFEDCTEAVLGASGAWGEQLVFGLDHWAARIQRDLGLSLGGHEGLAVGDANGDGLDDLYVCQPGGLPNRLFVRNPDGTATDVSARARVDLMDPTPSALFVDLDGDGDQDLAVQTDPVLLIYENRELGGAPRFGLRAELLTFGTTSISAADYDLDGDLDLFVCGYMLPYDEGRAPLPYHDANNGRPNVLLRNDVSEAGWAFADVTREVGLDVNNRRYSFAGVWEDYDDDGDPDLYVANDFGRNNLYRNDGGGFVDVAAEAGVEDMAAGMGVTWADVDGDGRMDLHVSNMFSSAGGRVSFQRRFMAGARDETRAGYQRHARGDTLFLGRADGTFADVTSSAGVGVGRWAWGGLFTDLQNDGRPDLFVPNGFVTGEDPDDL